jgi:hypothetical protein
MKNLIKSEAAKGVCMDRSKRNEVIFIDMGNGRDVMYVFNLII